uniref:Uncharacterized protein n=2 Tax=Pan TaxID=9596 RepID=A0A2I3TX26_PANTR
MLLSLDPTPLHLLSKNSPASSGCELSFETSSHLLGLTHFKVEEHYCFPICNLGQVPFLDLSQCLISCWYFECLSFVTCVFSFPD